jgi:hypothetical protein
LGVAQEPTLEVIVEDAFGFGDEGGEDGIFSDLQLREGLQTIEGADAEAG